MGKLLTTFLFLVLFIVISPVLPLKNIPKFFIVVSGSMEPVIKTGSLAITLPIDPKTLKIGDIVAFTSPNNPKDTVLHRLNSIKSTNPLRFSTKGDNNNTVDLWDLTDVGVLGLYQFSLPCVGNLIAFIRSPLGFILIICFPALLLVISEIFKIKNYLNTEINRRVKNKLKKNYPKIIILLFIFISASSTIFIKNVSALYSSAATTSALTFSIGELTPPESSIILDDNNTRNIGSFNISATATDNISVATIKLYYSFNFNSWQEFPEIIYGSNGDFHFSSPDGDGLYSFESIATDSSGNVETKVFSFFNNQIKVDTTPPTTNLNNQSLPSHIYTGQNYLINGNFENGMAGWTVASSIGDHHIINIGVTNNAFILGSDTKSINGTDSIYQTVSLPASVSATLTFSYRFLSHDIADYDHFNVNITDLSGNNILKNIINVGNLDTVVSTFDSGWQTLSQNINFLSGQTFKLLFSLTDTGEGDDYNSWAYLDDIKISTLDTRVGETSIIDYFVTDLGSDIAVTTPPTPLNLGENLLSFSSTDSAQNSEIIHHQSIVVSAPVVLNKITKNIISLFNNSRDETIDLNNYLYSIDSNSSISIIGSILPQQSFNIILSSTLPDSCQIKLFDNSNLVDSQNLTDLDLVSWQRSQDGLGLWVKINTPPSFNLESRLSVSKITLTVSGLASTLADMSYTIDFSDSSGPQQIYGQILPNTIDSQGISSRDFYLGTCSSGGTCIPVLGLGSSFVVTFSNLAPRTFIF